MTTYSALKDRLNKGNVIILDGATGTELERRGVPMDMASWSAVALKTHPHVVQQVHEDYIRAGADVITTNTFSSARYSLRRAGMEDLLEELNKRAVALAQEAREAASNGRDVFIAGSISTYSPDQVSPLKLSSKESRANYKEQAHLLAEAGVDLLILEMMRDLEQASYAIDAALSTGLPTWVGFSCQVNNDTGQVTLLRRPDLPFDQAIKTLLMKKDLQGSVVSVMHTNVDDTSPALEVLKEHWKGPMGAYPNSGWFLRPNWQFENVISPKNLTSEARKWVDMGVQLVGGCCGLGPDHIRTLKEQLPSRIP